MLSFLKSKPVLKDLLSDNYIDIHSHLLPGIDDGAKTIKDTTKLVTEFQKIGITQFITTPHISHYVWNNSAEIITARHQEVKLILEEKNTTIPFHAAAEYFMDDWFENHFKNEKLLTLKDNYVLVEISYQSPPIHLYKTLFELQVAGYTPVLAHPERYLYYRKDFSEYEKLKKVGCLFQLNLLSTVGYYGERITKIADELLKKGMYDFTGTDVHHMKHIASFSEKIKIDNVSNLKEVIKNNQFFKLH
ncbi:histidinol phosphatase [Flavobacterium sp. Leaf82]|jgi:protein-tyrosine phosphatase|uniref:tyrosine-protein phosphatase n=1 Tax=unclassified Flavobacterium TaxID=196869 RepID=UPI0006FBED05|nr:CpsB/CapC family capsule biosynthesis tyrosine phosphatase [Flavobacterium sp. Leaf82]KQO21452.1 histidinol phosphatase [Flavobacterium sp. Leaf82]